MFITECFDLNVYMWITFWHKCDTCQNCNDICIDQAYLW